MKHVLAILVVLSAPLFALHAASTPEEMTTRYFEAFKRGNAEAVADCMHEDEMAKLQQQLLPVIEHVDRLDPNSTDLEIAALRQLMGTSDAAAIRAESPRDFFVRFMKWVILRNPEMNKAIAETSIRVLGHVPDEDMAHVVLKVEGNLMGTSVSQTKVMTLKKQGEDWRMTLTGEIEGITRVMQMRARKGGM